MKKSILLHSFLLVSLVSSLAGCGPFDYAESNEFICLGNWNSVNETCDGECAEPFVTCEGRCCASEETCCEGTCCASDELCVVGDCCLPDCAQKACGDDGCGGSCGECGNCLECSAGACVAAEPCVAVECGFDGCGNTCGECPDFANSYCSESGTCECEPSCVGVSCGSDGCGGSCGTCPCGQSCQDGFCAAGDPCAGQECGPDGCGGSCGECSEFPSSLCDEGLCSCVPADCTDRECGDDGCGGSCGDCDGWGPCSVAGMCTSEFWTDATTGLSWVTAPPTQLFGWQDAQDYCEELSFGGFDDWRCPSIDELRSIIRGCPSTQVGGSCGVTEACPSCYDGFDCYSACSVGGGPQSPQCSSWACCYWPTGLGTWDLCSTEVFWSSTAGTMTNEYWSVNFERGGITTAIGENLVRCVRGL